MKNKFTVSLALVLIAASASFSGISVQGNISKIRVYSASIFVIELKSNYVTPCPNSPYSCNSLAVTGTEGYVKNMLAVALSAQSTGNQIFGWVDNVGTIFNQNGVSYNNILDGGVIAP